MASPAEMEAELKGSEDVGAAALGPDSALLLVVGEPFSAEQRELILAKITKDLKSWDTSIGCDINSELEAVATQAPIGEDGQNGEKQVAHTSETLQLDVLVNPEAQTLRNKLRSFLLVPARYHHLVYAGQVIQGAGSWILQDDLFTVANFLSICKEADVENAFRQRPEGSVFNISTIAEGDWNAAALAKQSISKKTTVNLNPESEVQEFNGLIQFTAYLSYFIKVRSMKELLAASDVVGNIRFSRPTLYIFPGAQGDSSLFGISGFNLLVNGGYSRKACFWDFTRHLDRIDALILTHLGYDNMFGLSSVLERKVQENVHPELGYVYFNAVEGAKHSPNGDAEPENGGVHKAASLTVSLVEEGNKLVENMKQLGQGPHPCTGVADKTGLHPINLYHKVGHGTLDMYILNPLQDNKELKEFLAQWNKNAKNFSGKGVPLPNACSMCALLVWKPSAPSDNITRILFPGNVPQQKVFEGLDKLKNLNILQHASCSERSLNAPKAAGPKKGTVASGKPPKAAGRTTPPQTPRPSEAKVEPKKALVEKKPPPITRPTGTAASKPAKDSKNKKAGAKPAEKKSPTASSVASTDTAKTTSPVGTPKASSTPSNTPTDRVSPPPPSPTEGVLEAAIPKAAEEISHEVPTIESIAEDAARPPAMDEPGPPVPGAVMEEELAPVQAQEPVEEPAPAPDMESKPVDAPLTNPLDSTELPEADQQPDAQQEPEAMQTENMGVPEPLPDPSQFDSAAFEAIAHSAQAKALEDAGVFESEQKMPESFPEAEVQKMEPEAEKTVVEAEQPIVEAEQPVVEAEQPVVEAEQPVVEAEQPVVEAEQPALEAEPPVLEAEQPVVKVEQPVVEAAQPGVEAEQLVVEAEQSVVEAEQPVVEAEQPVIEAEQPVVEAAQPELEAEQPVVEAEQPIVEAEQPVVDTEKPIVEGEQLVVEAKQPIVEAEQPAEAERVEEPVGAEESSAVSGSEPQAVCEAGGVDGGDIPESATLSPESEALPSQDREAVQPDLLAWTGAQEAEPSLEELGVYDSGEAPQGSGQTLEDLGIYDDEGVGEDAFGGASEPMEMARDCDVHEPREHIMSPQRLLDDDGDMEDDSLVEDLGKPSDNPPDIVSDAGEPSGGKVDLLGDFGHQQITTEGFSLVDGPRDHEPLQPDPLQFPQTTNPFLLGDADHQAQPDPLTHSMSPFDLVSPQQEDLAPAPPQFGATDFQERDSLEREDVSGSFDPLKEWGQPMGLPAPDPQGAKKAGAAEKKPAGAAGRTPAARKPAAAKTTAAGTAKKPTGAARGALDKSSLDTSRAKPVNDVNKNGTGKPKKKKVPTATLR